jgi:uncharacterized membrane protein
MGKGRLEAFSDAVLAIVITIMVLELKVPHDPAHSRSATLSSLQPLIPVFISYLLSFLYLGIYWNNHHHMLHAVQHINGAVLWANFHLLFWLSLVPFVTWWVGENHFALWPVVLYGCVLIMAAIAYFILSKALIKIHGKSSVLAKALGNDWKGKISLVMYALGIGLSFVHPWIGFSLYAAVASIWFIPDKRIEKQISHIQKN